MAHTPGPWKVDYDGDSGPIVVSFTPRFEIVALVKSETADAHLLAAAPDLLAAVQLALDCYVAGNWAGHEAGDVFKAAIEKAKWQPVGASAP